MNKFIKIITGIVVIFFIGWLGLSLSNKTQNPVANTNAIKIKVTKDARAPKAIFTTINGKQITLSSFKGKKVMLWMLATWCSSCSAGVQVLAQNNSKLNGLIIIALKTYGDAGYPGPSIKEFKQKYMPASFSGQNWLWGDASQNTTRIYNPLNYPDIYFLIDKDGVVREINDAPAATINGIIKFANK